MKQTYLQKIKRRRKNFAVKLLFITLILFLSGCATYNPYKDPVYQAYLAGEVSYAQYLEHHDRMVALQQQQTATALGYLGQQQAIRQQSQSQHIYVHPVSPLYQAGYDAGYYGVDD